MRATRNDKPKPMGEPLKRHGDKLKREEPAENNRRPPVEPNEETLLEPEREGGIGGP